MHTKRVGIIVPSSNTALEPLTTAMLSEVTEASVHFCRFPVTEISLGEFGINQFKLETILRAAEMLADAKVDVIGWSGTSASWLGFEHDVELCGAIEKKTGIKATSSVLALNKALKLVGAKAICLVTPYVSEVQKKITENYGRLGYRVATERHLGISVNYDFAVVEEEELRRLLLEVASNTDDPEAVLVPLCTNLRSARLAEQIESRTNMRVFDSCATVVWDALRLIRVDPGQVSGWGSLFKLK